MTHLRKRLRRIFLNTLVPILKFAQHLLSSRATSFIGEGQDAGDDPPRDVVAAGIKGAHQHRERSGIKVGPMRFAWTAAPVLWS